MRGQFRFISKASIISLIITVIVIIIIFIFFLIFRSYKEGQINMVDIPSIFPPYPVYKVRLSELPLYVKHKNNDNYIVIYDANISNDTKDVIIKDIIQKISVEPIQKFSYPNDNNWHTIIENTLNNKNIASIIAPVPLDSHIAISLNEPIHKLIDQLPEYLKEKIQIYVMEYEPYLNNHRLL